MSNTPTIDPKKPTLVSFSLCPFVQRSVIAMNAKGEDFTRIDIDLKNKPAWFLDRVPTGKVPALLIEGEVVFESAVISEFVDESYGAPLLAREPLERAHERAWIAFAGTLISQQFGLLSASNEADYEKRKELFLDGIVRLGAQAQGAFFRGASLSLLDTAVAPIFTRLVLVPELLVDVEKRAAGTNLVAWIENLVALPEVKNSVVDDFDEQFRAFFQAMESYVLTL